VVLFALEAASNAGANEHSEADISAGHGICSSWSLLFRGLLELRSGI
jgi:hypothetical protein